MNGLNVAFGAERRLEQYKIYAGEIGSYALYDTSGVPVTSPTQVIPVDPISGEQRPSGSQGFPGFSPKNELSERRTSTSAYIDTELDLTDKLLISIAARFENYSDFGNTFNGKFASLLKLAKGFNMRWSVSSGFRAPSLAQLYFNTNFTNFTSSGASEILLSQNDSPVTNGFGIPKLKEEKCTLFISQQ